MVAFRRSFVVGLIVPVWSLQRPVESSENTPLKTHGGPEDPGTLENGKWHNYKGIIDVLEAPVKALRATAQSYDVRGAVAKSKNWPSWPGFNGDDKDVEDEVKSAEQDVEKELETAERSVEVGIASTEQDVEEDLETAEESADHELESAKEKIESDLNFCSNSKLVPKFYMLGAPKCASTSLSEDLLRGAHEGNYAFYAAPRRGSQKEWHFWHKFKASDNVTNNIGKWLEELEDCPKEPAMLGDFNINNLAAVPLPKDLTEESLGHCTCDKDYLENKLRDLEHDVPRNLEEAYGSNIDGVTFVVMIREPLARIQSAWYHARYEKFDKYWGFSDCCTESFNEAVRRIVEGGNDIDTGKPTFNLRLGGEGSVWVSMYGRHLEAYMRRFNATQFVVIPYRQYFDGAKKEICDDISARLDHKVCKDGDPFHDENSHPHPRLDEDIEPRLLDIFAKMFGPENKRLVDILSVMHEGGAKLAGFKGVRGNRADVKQWLFDSW